METTQSSQPLPERVTRSRAELEQLREDARASQLVDPDEVRMLWVSPDGVASALEAVIDTTRWLLGERDRAPISRELYDYPELPVAAVRTNAEDAIYGYRWTEVGEWYAGGVKRTLEWATSPEADRPIMQ